MHIICIEAVHELQTWPTLYTELEIEKETYYIAFMLKMMMTVSRWTKEDEEMRDCYYSVSMLNGVLNTPPGQLVYVLFLRMLEEKVAFQREI